MKRSSTRSYSVIRSHYDRILDLHGTGPEAVGWGSRKSQELRFFILSQIGDLKGKTILDVGCGFGDLYGYLVKRNSRAKRYLGVDMNETMIAKAKKRYPDAQFQIVQSLKEFSDSSFDYVVESGIFNLQVPGWRAATFQVLRDMFRVSKKGVGANFLSAFSPFLKDKNSFYANPLEIARAAFKAFTPKIVLRHEYKPNDFTLFLYK